MQAKKAYLINYFSRFSSLTWRAVSFSVSSLFSTIPLLEFTPTQQTIALHWPLLMIEPAVKHGSCWSFWTSLVYSRLPSAESFRTGSSTTRSWASIIKQSAGTLAPVSKRMTSPTTTSQTLILCVAPSLPLITGTCSSLISFES